MKFRIDKKMMLKIGFILIFLFIAPFAVEVVILADVVGVEFAVTFLFLYLRSNWLVMQENIQRFKLECLETVKFLSFAYIFQPKVYFIHTTVSCFFIIVTGSTILATALWVPAVLMSVGAFGPIV